MDKQGKPWKGRQDLLVSLGGHDSVLNFTDEVQPVKVESSLSSHPWHIVPRRVRKLPRHHGLICCYFAPTNGHRFLHGRLFISSPDHSPHLCLYSLELPSSDKKKGKKLERNRVLPVSHHLLVSLKCHNHSHAPTS